MVNCYTPGTLGSIPGDFFTHILFIIINFFLNILLSFFFHC